MVAAQVAGSWRMLVSGPVRQARRYLGFRLGEVHGHHEADGHDQDSHHNLGQHAARIRSKARVMRAPPRLIRY
ncbi:MAG TPA: hypothetical protein VGI96_16570 [Streptosporangiaceae bacterium]